MPERHPSLPCIVSFNNDSNANHTSISLATIPSVNEQEIPLYLGLDEHYQINNEELLLTNGSSSFTSHVHPIRFIDPIYLEFNGKLIPFYSNPCIPNIHRDSIPQQEWSTFIEKEKALIKKDIEFLQESGESPTKVVVEGYLNSVLLVLNTLA